MVYEGGAKILSFVDQLDRPGAAVRYQLIAINGAGSGVSETRAVQLPLEAPEEFPLVNVYALSPTSVRVNWGFGENEDIRNVNKYTFKVVVQEDDGNPQLGITSTTISTPRRGKRSTDGGVGCW